MPSVTTYFDEASSEHTPHVIEIVRTYLEANPQINDILVATTTGATGLAVSREFSGRNVVAVTHHTGFKVPDENELIAENKERILGSGGKLLTTTHAFAGVARGIRKAIGTWTPTEMMALAFRTFGQGTKVCAEIAMMAADAGLVRTDQEVLCIAGTGYGADTAWIIQPAHTNNFTELRMKQCLCKPKNF
ncbi:MAG: hypothetical protein EAX95_05600 [Candidatus Thorarchaeota archaeon]|nr:hypothetical protein [Candidatus Thorarchaeota archaeon]